MIENFSVYYVGTIDLDEVGLLGKPANDRWYPNEQLVEAFDFSLEFAKLMDRLGYHSLWLAEHHFGPEGYECIPNILMLSVHLAHHTQHLRFGCGFNIPPNWHPLRLAEDFAMADILTGGRVIFGVGRGAQSREAGSLGAPVGGREANRELFEEQVELIFKAFNSDSFSHHGKHYHIPPALPFRGYELEEITLVPRPVHTPVEVWQPIVSATHRGLDFMGRMGIKGVVLAAGDERVDGVFHEYQEAAARHGRELELGEDLSLGFRIFIDDTEEKAKRAMTPYFEEYMKFGAPLGIIPGLTPEQLESVANPALPKVGLPTIEGVVRNHAYLCGTSETIVSYLKELEERYPGLRNISVATLMGMPKAVFMEQLQRFAEEVMPAFPSQ